jgi:hypothetical protein
VHEQVPLPTLEPLRPVVPAFGAADVAAVLAAAGLDDVAHSATGERLRYIARRLAELVVPGNGRPPG